MTVALTFAIIGAFGLLMLAAVRWIVIPLIDQPERPLAPEDQVTYEVMRDMRAEDTGGLMELHHDKPQPFPAAAGRWASTLHSAPIWTAVQLRGALTWLTAITNVPGRDGKSPAESPTAASGGQHSATAHATVTGDRGPAHVPAGDLTRLATDAERADLGPGSDHIKPPEGCPAPAPTAEAVRSAEERWPDLIRPWADDTGTFTFICEGSA